jgi:hypothetical protein
MVHYSIILHTQELTGHIHLVRIYCLAVPYHCTVQEESQITHIWLFVPWCYIVQGNSQIIHICDKFSGGLFHSSAHPWATLSAVFLKKWSLYYFITLYKIDSFIDCTTYRPGSNPLVGCCVLWNIHLSVLWHLIGKMSIHVSCPVELLSWWTHFKPGNSWGDSPVERTLIKCNILHSIKELEQQNETMSSKD